MSHRLCKGCAFVGWSRLDLEKEVDRLRNEVKGLKEEVSVNRTENRSDPMSVKLIKNNDDGTICVSDMKDGQLAEVVKWGGSEHAYVGWTIHRCGNRLNMIGRHCGYSLGIIFEERHEDCRVRLLRPGELIEVVENDGK